MRRLDSIRVRSLGGVVAGVPTGTNVAPQQLGLHPAPTAGRRGRGVGSAWAGQHRRAHPLDRRSHPDQPDTIWAASAGGGVWRTDDAGASWQPVDDLMANLAVTSVAIDPTNPDVMYAGTGEGFFNLDAIRGAGIFRTTDGVSWAMWRPPRTRLPDGQPRSP